MISKAEQITLQVYIMQNVSAEFVKIAEKKGCTSNLLKGLLFWVSLVVISVIAKCIVEKILPKCSTMIEKRIFIQNS